MTSRTPRDPEALLVHADWVRALVHRLVRDPERAADVEQETWLEALRAAPAGHPNPRAWLARVVQSRAARSLRSSERRQRREQTAARPDEEASTAALVARAEEERALVGRVLALPAPQRDVLLLRYFEGLPPRRIAHRLGRPLETVRTQLQRGLARLRRELDREHGERATWCALLLPTARDLGWSLPLTAAQAGTLLMHTTTKVAAAAAVALVAAVAAVNWTDPDDGARAPGDDAAVAEVGLPAADDRPASDTVRAAPDRRVAVPSDTPAGEAAPLARLRGWVVHADDDRGLSGLRVRLEAEGRDEPLERVTDSDGAFTLESDEALRLLSARVAPGPRTAAANQTLDLALEPGATETLRLEVGAGMRVRGVVVDLDDEPIPGAEIRGWCAAEPDGDPDRRTTTGADGRFVLDALGQNFSVEAVKSGWVGADRIYGQSALQRETEELTLRLAPPMGLTVTVVDSRGSPVAGVDLEVCPRGPSAREGVTRTLDVFRLPAHSERDATNAEGQARFEALPAVPLRVTAAHPGFESASVGVEPRTETAVVELVEAERIRGVVVDPGGEPVEGAQVALRQYGVLDETRTDAQGRFDLDSASMPAHGGRTWIAVRAEGFAVHAQERVRRGDPPLRLQLEPARAIAGVLLGVDGKPAPGVEIEVRGERILVSDVVRPWDIVPTWEVVVGDAGDVATGADGRFRVESLYAGAFLLVARFEHEGSLHRQEWTVQGGEEDLLLRMNPGQSHALVLEGRITDSLTGAPIPEFTVQVSGSRGEPWMGNAGAFTMPPTVFRSADGTYRVEGVEPMPTGILVSAEGYRRDGVTPTPRSPGTHRIDLALSPVRSLHLRVLDADDEPMAHAIVQVIDEQGRNLWVRSSATSTTAAARTDEEGESVLQDLPAALLEFHVYWDADGVEPLERAVFPLDLTEPRPDVEVLQVER